jgi:branched-chain amino acid transport system ATP-binding protein
LPPPEAPRVIGGDIRFQGQSILQTRPSDVVKDLHLALCPEGRHIFGNLSVMENLVLATYSRDKDADLEAEYARIFSLFPRLKERSLQRGDTLSGGEQQMLAVGRALMTGCRILVLDEPSMGLAPVLKYELFRKLKQLNEEGMTILLVEQNANLALNLAHRGLCNGYRHHRSRRHARAIAGQPGSQTGLSWGGSPGFGATGHITR